MESSRPNPLFPTPPIGMPAGRSNHLFTQTIPARN
ncbi:unannotated protein [freshwater metagenome]|uniref:Unannotated protein n=1 Tax=freshwater metagenome TaxID=449393 RepID=A0A6J6UV72_9ZZZZ